MSGYRGGCFACPFYSRDYRDYLNCEGGQLKMPKEALDDYMARYCANSTAMAQLHHRPRPAAELRKERTT